MNEKNEVSGVPMVPEMDQPTGLKSDGKSDGILELAVPNLLPTDNVGQVREIELERIKVPVRITKVEIKVVDNGYVVELPQAGQQDRWGPDGAHHVFHEKKKLLEFIGMVLGQVTYQYRERELCENETGIPSDGVQATCGGG